MYFFSVLKMSKSVVINIHNYIFSPNIKVLYIMRILDIFSPYSRGLMSGWNVSQYSDKKMRNMSGIFCKSNLLCTISKKHPKEKLVREARWGVQVLRAFCLVCLEPEKHTLRILIYVYTIKTIRPKMTVNMWTSPKMLLTVVSEHASLTT